jgi:WD40 repeat protein
MASLASAGYAAEAFAAGPLAFSSPSHFAMTCGNALRLVPTQNGGGGAGSEREGEMVRWCEGASVGALDAAPAHGVIAYGERLKTLQDPRVFIYSVGQGTVRATLLCEGELGIVALALCNDPEQRLLVTLGEIPDHNITVWDWGVGSMLARVSAQGSRARSVSFDPLDCTTIASVGSKLELWTLSTEESGKRELHAEPPTNIDKEERELTAHCWAPGKTLFLGSDSGEICHVNARTGCKVYGSTWTKVSASGIGALALSSKHVLAGTSEGTEGVIHWVSYPLQGSSTDAAHKVGYAVEKSSPMLDGPVKCLSVSPDWTSLAIATAQGTVSVCSLDDPQSEEGGEADLQLLVREVGHGFPDGGVNAMASLSRLPVVCTAGQRGSVTLWMAPSLQIISTTKVSASHEATCVAVADEAHVLVAGSSAGEVTAVDISDLAEPRLVFSARLHSSPVTAVSVSQNWLASAALGGKDGYIALSRIQGGSSGVLPIGRIMNPSSDGKSSLLHMQLHGNVILATTSAGEMFRIALPDGATSATAKPLKVAAEAAQVSASVHCFILEPGADESTVRLIGWCADRGLRCWAVSVTGAFSAELVTEWKGSASIGTALAAGSDHRGNTIVLAGARDGSITLRSQSSLGANAPVVTRHIGAAAAIKGGFSAEPSANLHYEPMVVGRGGVSGVAVGAGVLRGWIVSAGRDGSLIAQALDESLPPPRPSLPAPASGLLAPSPSVSKEHAASEDKRVGAGPGRVLWEEWDSEGGAPAAGVGLTADFSTASRGEAGAKVLSDLAKLRATFQGMLDHNKTCPEIERLERTELTVDVAEKARKVALADAEALRVSHSIQRENALRELLSQKIKTNCHDSMETTLLSIVPLDGTAPPGLVIESYPVAKMSAEEETRLKRVRMMRRLEIAEDALAKENGLPTSRSDSLRMTHVEMQRVMAERGGKGGSKKSDTKAADEDGDDDGEGDGDAGAADGKKMNGDEVLLYDALQLSTRQQRLNQIELQRSRIRTLKADFNERLKKAIKDKSSVIDKLDEKKSRLAEIKEACGLFIFSKNGTEKLEVDENYALAACEEGKQLAVKDTEISAPKYQSAADRAAKEAAEAEERARQAAKGSDDAVGRALNDMMYGTLEARKADDHSVLDEKPAFYDAPNEQLSDEQIKQKQEYDKKEKNAADDEDKQRKALEAEAKKIKADMQQLIEEFHKALSELADLKLGVQRNIHAAELEVVLLWQAIVRDDDREIKIREFSRHADTAQLDLNTTAAAVSLLRQEIDDFRLTYETVLAEDKACDRAFKKEVGEYIFADELTKLFKKRSYAHESLGGPGRSQLSRNPYEAIALAKEEAFPRPERLDWDAENIDGMVPGLSQRLDELRERKIDTELQVKRMAAELMGLNNRLQELQLLHKDAVELCDKLHDDLNKLQEEREMDAYNLVMLLHLKQGQVEVDMDQLLDETFDAAMMEGSQISQLNSIIEGLGGQKVEMMAETKSFRNKIHGVSWHNEMLDFKAMEVTENIKYVQLLWVTKDLQSVIKGGADDRKQKQIHTLEKQMDHSQQLHELKVQDMKSRLFRAHKQIREKELENNKLTEYVQDLAVSVAQREKIMRVRRSEEESADDREYKMQEVVWRRLVLEEARQQSEDIAILKAEVPIHKTYTLILNTNLAILTPTPPAQIPPECELTLSPPAPRLLPLLRFFSGWS